MKPDGLCTVPVRAKIVYDRRALLKITLPLSLTSIMKTFHLSIYANSTAASYVRHGRLVRCLAVTFLALFLPLVTPAQKGRAAQKLPQPEKLVGNYLKTIG